MTSHAVTQKQKRATLITAVLGSGIVFLDSTVVGVALPRIGRELPRHVVGVLEGQFYVYAGYLLSLSALLILAGAVSDHFGRRRVFVVGLVGFGVTSGLCGLSPSMEVLILARVTQGAFGALLVPGSLALLTVAFTGEEKGRAFGLWASASAATTLFGPLAGGVLVDALSWRAAFLINVPIIALTVALARGVPESRDDSSQGRFDWGGAGITTLAVGGLVVGATEAGQRGFDDPTTIAGLVIGTAGCIALPLWLMHTKTPLIPLALFRSRNFSVINISTLLIYGALYVTFYYLALLYQGVLGYSATAAGIAGIPASILLVLLSARIGRFAAQRSPRLFLTMGPILMTCGLLWFLRVTSASVAWNLQPGNVRTWLPPLSYVIDFLPGVLVFGAGLTILVAPLTNALMESIPEANAGVGSAVNNALSRVGPQLAGAAIFIAITGAFFSSLVTALPGVDTGSPQVRNAVSALNVASSSVEVVRDHGGTDAGSVAIRQAFVSASIDAYRVATLVGVGLLLLGAGVNFFGLEHRTTRSPDSDKA